MTKLKLWLKRLLCKHTYKMGYIKRVEIDGVWVNIIASGLSYRSNICQRCGKISNIRVLTSVEWA